MPISPITVVNVEDEQVPRRARTLVLQRAGYRVLEAAYAEEAIRLAEQEQPALFMLPSESDEHWRVWADSAPALIWVNGPTGCEFVNREYLRFLGVSDGDVYGSEWAAFVHRDDRDAYVASYLEAVERRSLFEATFRFRRHDGEYRWMKSVGTPRFGVQEEFLGYVGSTLDITDIYFGTRARVTQPAGQAEPLPRGREGQGARGLATPDRKVLSEYGMALGATLLALLARLVLDPLLGDHSPYVTFLAAVALTTLYGGLGASLTAVLLSGVAANWFFLPPRHSLQLTDVTQQVGFATYVVATLTIVGFGQAWRRAGVVTEGLRREVIERQRAEAAWRANEERLRLAMDAAQVGSWDWDMVTGDILWTPQHELMLGYEPGTPHRTYADFHMRLHPEDAGRVEVAVRQAIEQRTDYRCEFRVVWPDGSVHWLAGAGIVHRDSDGRPIRMLGMIVDITARKCRERNLVFLADMQRAFAPLSSAADIMRVASERIAEHLVLTHCSLVEINEAADECMVLHDHRAAGVPNMEGVYRLSDFHHEEERRLLGAGGTLVIHDVREDLRTAARVERFAALGIGVLLNAGYVADGRWKFVLHASHGEPYAWPSEDSELLADLAARIYVRLERARVEEALRVSEEFSRMVLESSPDCIKVLDADGRLERMNTAGMCLLEIADFADFRGKQWETLWPEESQRRIAAAIATAKEGRMDRFQAFCPTAKGTPKWWDVIVAPVRDGEGRILRLVSASRDITERKRTEEALRESEQEFRSLAEAVPQIVWATRPDGWNIYFSQQWVDYTGLTLEESYGHGWNTPFHPDDKQRAWEAWQRAIQHNAPYSLECRLRRADGAYRWWLIRGAPMRSANGEIQKWFGTCTDIEDLKQGEQALQGEITERKRAEEQVHRLNSELEHRVTERTQELVQSQTRLRALATELTLTEQRERQRLATELHDYLAQLLALSKIKLAQAKQQATIPAITKAVADVQQVMDQALAYTRTLVAQLSPPFLHDFGLRMALQWLAEQMQQRDLTVSLEMERETLPLPENQAVLLFQSVRELLINVVKHGDTSHATVTVTEADGVLRITVIDQGAGCDLSAAAEKARSVPSFGLFSIRERMAAMGGTFSMTSAPGQGTTATLELPLAAQPDGGDEPKTLSVESGGQT